IQRCALGDALAELVRPGGELGIGERLELALELVDAFDDLAIALQQPLVATAEHLGQECLDHAVRRGCGRPESRPFPCKGKSGKSNTRALRTRGPAAFSSRDRKSVV